MLPKEERLSELYETAFEVFSTYGYRKATLDDIASRMGMTKGNIYFYVKNKQDLYEKVLERALVHWRESVRARVAEKTDCVTRFREMALASIAYIDQNVALRAILVKDPTIFSLSSKEDRFYSVNQQAMGIIRNTLEQGIKENVFYPMDVGAVTEYLFSVYVMFLIKTYVKSDSRSSETMFLAAVDLTLRGLLRRPEDA